MPRQHPLVEGLDYYLEHGKMVLSAHYLQHRGYCCGNGCRHCPYPKEVEPPRSADRDPANTAENQSLRMDIPPEGDR